MTIFLWPIFELLVFFQATDWLSLLIDAHVTQLIVSPDSRMLLGNLHEIVTEQVSSEVVVGRGIFVGRYKNLLVDE